MQASGSVCCRIGEKKPAVIGEEGSRDECLIASEGHCCGSTLFRAQNLKHSVQRIRVNARVPRANYSDIPSLGNFWWRSDLNMSPSMPWRIN
jgi:hypothetical protein